ncbi:MAG: DUF484 family protein [Methylophilaceae bacterium]
MQQENQQTNTIISAEQVSSYLRSFPNFFEQHASLLTEIYLPSPHGKGAISLAERQQLAQRDKIQALETKLHNLISFAEENDKTSKKVHDLSVNLLKSSSFELLQAAIIQSMQQDFLVTESAIRLWVNPNETEAETTEFTPENKAFITWVNELKKPYCGEKTDITKGLLDDNLHSFAFIPLYKDTPDESTPHESTSQENIAHKQTFGILILGSVDAQHFKPDMGVMYLERIGELVSAALLLLI